MQADPETPIGRVQVGMSLQPQSARFRTYVAGALTVVGFVMVIAMVAALPALNDADRETIAESLENYAAVCRGARERNLPVRAYLSTAFGCPYDGAVDPGRAAALTARLIEMGAYEVAVSDTIGVAHPGQVRTVLPRILAREAVALYHSPVYALPSAGAGRTALVLTVHDLLEMQAGIREIYVDSSVADYIVRLVNNTRTHPDVYLGASPRGSIALYRAGQALAGLLGRDYVIPDDVKALAEACLQYALEVVSRRHKLKSPPFAVIGLGKLGQSLVVEASRLWWEATRGSRGSLEIDVIDLSASSKVAMLLARYPQLQKACHLVPCPLPVQSPC